METHLCNCTGEECDAPIFKRLYHYGDECIHVDGTSHLIKKEEMLRVQYKFKDDPKIITVTVTEQQYVNLMEVAAIETCDIIGSTSQPISQEEKQEFNKKIVIVCGEGGYTKYLLE